MACVCFDFFKVATITLACHFAFNIQNPVKGSTKLKFVQR